MSLGKYFSEMESVKFEVLFSIFSSFRHVLAEMAENETLQRLIDELIANPSLVKELHARLEHLLVEVQANDDIPRDGCIAGYLYCLWKTDLASAFEASKAVLEFGGLWWSVQLALHVSDYVSQIMESVHFTSSISETYSPFTIDRIASSAHDAIALSSRPEAIDVRPKIFYSFSLVHGSLSEVDLHLSTVETFRYRPLFNNSFASTPRLELSIES